MRRVTPTLTTLLYAALLCSLTFGTRLVASEPATSEPMSADYGSHARIAGLLTGPECGYAIRPVYTGELFSNTRGGISTRDATQYQALLDLGLEIDLVEAGSVVPGKVFILAQNTHGRGITENFVGDAQVLSNIDSGDNITQISEYWWETRWFDDSVTVRIGKQDLNTEFLFLDTAEDFINSSFGLTPALSLPTFPTPSMGAIVLAQLNEFWQFKVGIWDAFAFGGSWGISGNGTVLVVSELEHKYELCEGELPGTLTFGGGYLSDGEISGQALDASHGFLLQLEQLVWREAGSGRGVPQGCALFFSYVPRFFSGRKKDDSLGDNFVGGIVYRGLFPNRDLDVIGVGVAWAEIFQGGTGQETVFECFYKANITPELRIQPDIQYIASPSGVHRDALAVGLRVELDL